MALDDGNGRKIAAHEEQIKLLIDLAKESNSLLREMFGPNGVCPRERSKTAKMETQVTVQWWFIAGICIALIGLAFHKL